MRQLILILLFMFAMGGQAVTDADDDVAELNGYVRGQKYDFNLTAAILSASPSWPEDQDEPPLAPRVAERIARKQLASLVPDADLWRLNAVSLQPARDNEKWFYVVHYTGPLPPGTADGMVPILQLVVLMNGNTVQPEISEWKPQ